MLQVARGKGRDVFLIPLTLKRRFRDLFIFLFLQFGIEFALLPFAPCKGMSAKRMSGLSIQMVVKLSLCLLEGVFNCIIRLNG